MSLLVDSKQTKNIQLIAFSLALAKRGLTSSIDRPLEGIADKKQKSVKKSPLGLSLSQIGKYPRNEDPLFFSARVGYLHSWHVSMESFQNVVMDTAFTGLLHEMFWHANASVLHYTYRWVYRVLKWVRKGQEPAVIHALHFRTCACC